MQDESIARVDDRISALGIQREDISHNLCVCKMLSRPMFKGRVSEGLLAYFSSKTILQVVDYLRVSGFLQHPKYSCK